MTEWLTDLDDLQARQIIRLRLRRLHLGNFGYCEVIGDGVSELKIDFGPGYRIYYTLIKRTKILVLWAGTKRTQKRDILKAKNYLIDFKMREGNYENK